MCGASDEQTETYQAQKDFYQEGIKQQQKSFGDDMELLQAMRSIYMPIFTAGPSQEGFSPGMKAALESGVIEGTAQNYAKAAKIGRAHV